MPTLDEIRTVTIQAKTDGVTQSTDQVNKLADSQSKLADLSAKATVVTDNQTRSHLSAQTALDRLRRQIDTNFASQHSLAKGQDVLTRAQQQGLISGALHADLLGKLNEKYSVLTPAETKFAEAAAVVESRMVGMSASVGLVGEVLSVIGPYGLAAAAGIGAFAVAAVKLTESANSLGEWARQLKDTADTVRLNTTELQALETIGTRVGVSVESNITAFERFTVELGRLKSGNGSLYLELEKVNPALVDQLSVTKNNTAAWNLLAQAYAHADEQQQALIAHAAFGRGGAAEGRVLSATAQAGGLGGLVDQNAANAFTQKQIDQWSALETKISTTLADANRNIASVFTGPVLAAESVFVDKYLEFSKAATGFSPSSAWHQFINDMKTAPLDTYITLVEKAAKLLVLGPLNLLPKPPSAASQGYGYPAAPPPLALASAGFPTTLGSFPSTPQPDIAASLGVQVSRQKELITVLGSAATAYDHLKLKLLELDVVQQDHTKGITDEEIARGRGAASLDAQIAVESKRNGLLGDLASATALAKQKDDELNRARMDGIKFSTAEIQAMKERNQLLAESSRLENQLVFARQQLFKSSADQSVDATLRAAGIPPASERAAAIRDYVRMTDALSQANSIGGTFASGFLTDISHGVNAIDALRSALTRVADTLIDMAARQLFTQALGGLTSGLSGPVSTGTFGHNAMGNAFDRGNVIPFARGDIIDRPIMFPMANGAGLMGEAGPEAIVPLKRGSDGRLGVASSGGSSAPITMTVKIDLSGHMTKQDVAQVAQQAALQGAQLAIKAANANAPARQLSYQQLGT